MKTQKKLWSALAVLVCVQLYDVVAQPAYDYSKLQKEQLGRGVVAIRENPSDVVVSWRYLSSDPIITSFNVYRNGEKIAEVPHSTGTFYRDTYSGNEKAVYTVKPVINGVETGKLNGNYTFCLGLMLRQVISIFLWTDRRKV